MSETVAITDPPDPARVASAQRLLILSMVVVLIAIAIDYGFASSPIARWVSLGVECIAIVISVIGIVHMGRAMRSPLWLTVVCCLTALVGIVNLIVLAWLNARAINVLRAAGWKVGFFGARGPAG
jgi:hypothetical protein